MCWKARILVVIEGHEILLSPGDSIYFDARHGHGMNAAGGTTQPASWP